MAYDILEMVKNSGVVGAGGAGFPTHVKLNARVKYVIVNGAECEPLLRANQQIMDIYSKELWSTLKILLKETGASFGVIALKNKYKEAMASLRRDKPKDEKLSITELGDFYPAGDEQVLVHEVTKIVVPEGSIPLKVGCVVINVETLLNVFFALEGMPVTHKFVTITGAVKNPITLKVPLGCKVKNLINLAGGAAIRNYKVIDGGPMMGSIADDGVITKTTGGIIVLPENHKAANFNEISLRQSLIRARAACCQCRICTDMCPRYLLGHDLEPHKIMRAVGFPEMGGAQLTNAYLCSECAVCDKFACPMGLSPRIIIKMLKSELNKAGIKNTHLRTNLLPQEGRNWRKIASSRLISRLGLEEYDLPAPIVNMKINPEEVCISLKQHIGEPALPVVNVGDKVEFGQLIGVMPEKGLGANIHASISGIVAELNENLLIKRL
ncbi:MAG: hypothetical protein VR72_15830 [Clostridiaceae bacterium BRH_c20a]|nr:MAG: hypothetical protein VR72_15830 [Clostridiaceae bacterium BRH_c20a]